MPNHKKQSNKVLLVSRFAELDFEIIKEYLKDNYPNIEIIHINNVKNPLIRFFFNQIKIMWHLRTSRGCIVDSFVLPIGFTKTKPATKVIQVWHALGAVKKFGYTALDTNEGTTEFKAKIARMHKGYDYVCASGSATIKSFTKSFGVDESKVLPIGMPRVDYLLSKTSKIMATKQLYKKYPQLNNGKNNVLYAPTYRKNGDNAILELIKEHNPETSNLVIGHHPLRQKPANLPAGVIYADDVNFMDLLFVTDILMSDYSAAIMEAAVLDIPTIFYLFDLEDYTKDRGLFFEFENSDFILPGPIINKPKDIWSFIANPKFNIDQFNKFKKMYSQPSSENCTAEIVNLLSLDD